MELWGHVQMSGKVFGKDQLIYGDSNQVARDMLIKYAIGVKSSSSQMNNSDFFCEAASHESTNSLSFKTIPQSHPINHK